MREASLMTERAFHPLCMKVFAAFRIVWTDLKGVDHRSAFAPYSILGNIISVYWKPTRHNVAEPADRTTPLQDLFCIYQVPCRVFCQIGMGKWGSGPLSFVDGRPPQTDCRQMAGSCPSHGHLTQNASKIPERIFTIARFTAGSVARHKCSKSMHVETEASTCSRAPLEKI